MTNFQVLDELRVKTPQGIKIFPPGEIIKIPEEKAISLVLKGKLCPIKSYEKDAHLNITETIREIEKTYASGAVWWCQQEKPDWWNRVIALEEKINKTAKNGDIPHLEVFLQKWRKEITSIVRTFIETSAKSKKELAA